MEEIKRTFLNNVFLLNTFSLKDLEKKKAFSNNYKKN